MFDTQNPNYDWVKNASREAQTATLAVAGGPVGIAAYGHHLRNRRQENRPEAIGERVGSSANGFDALTEGQRRRMGNFSENDWEAYRRATETSVNNAVRSGAMTPAEAQQRMQRANYAVNNADTPAEAQLGMMSAADLPDATSHLGDTNGLGMDDEYFTQLNNAALKQQKLTEQIGDMSVSREFDRTVKYRLPIENYKMNRDFAYQQKGAQNEFKRANAQSLLNTYAQTAQALITSGL